MSDLQICVSLVFEILQKAQVNKSQPVSRNYRDDMLSCLSIHLRLLVLKLSCLRLYDLVYY